MRGGARIGLVSWSAYALVEYLFTTFPAWAQQPCFCLWHWLYNAALFVLYPLAGLICGALAGQLVQQLARRRLLPAATEMRGPAIGRSRAMPRRENCCC